MGSRCWQCPLQWLAQLQLCVSVALPDYCCCPSGSDVQPTAGPRCDGVEEVRRSPRRASPRRTIVSLAAALLLGACGSGTTSPTSSAPSRVLLEQMRPLGQGTRFRPPGKGVVIGRCSRTLGSRVGVHLELFAEDRVALVPAGLGTRPPRQLTAGRISRASCYGDLVTLEPTGVVHRRPG